MNPRSGGGGGALRYLGGCIRSLSKFKNTRKALISGQKSTGIGKTGTRILTLDFVILCLFGGSRLGSPCPGAHVTSGVTRRQSRVHIVDCKGIFTPHTSYLGTKKKYPSFTKSWTCGGLKKDPFFRGILNASAAPLYLSPPPPPREMNMINPLPMLRLFSYKAQECKDF